MEEGESVWLIPILECILHLNAASCGRLATDPSQHVCVCDIFSCNNISLHNVGIIPIPLLMCTISVWHTSMASMNNDAVNVCISIGWFNLANISTSDIGFKLRIGHSLILGCSEGPHFYYIARCCWSPFITSFCQNFEYWYAAEFFSWWSYFCVIIQQWCVIVRWLRMQ